MPNVWTINSVTGGPTRNDLQGCRIQINQSSTAYELMQGNNLLASSTNNGALPPTPFSFVNFGLAGYTWTVTVNTLTGGASHNQAEGVWRNNAPNPAEAEDGTFTAQAGSGIDTDLPEEEQDDAATASA